MKTLLLASTLVIAGLTSAHANDISVKDHYKTVIDRDPYNVEVCYDVNVPGDKSGDMLKGAIIGGIIGNNVGDVKNGGALGAVLGGMFGHSNSTATGGTKRQCRVETRYKETVREIYSHSIIMFWHNGKHHRARFQK